MSAGLLSALAWATLAALATATPSGVAVKGRRLFVNGAPVHLKGVNWNPVPKGRTHPFGIDYRGSVIRDAELMHEAKINALRSYECICNTEVLDELWRRGIFVLNTVFANAREGLDRVPAKVHAVKDHPAVLMWVVGNEWNYNGCYDELSHDRCLAYIREAASIVKWHDPRHPVATIYGRLPRADVLRQLSIIDIWGTNYYHGLGFRDQGLGGTGDLFREWEALSGLPLFVGEYGADAWNTHQGQEDPIAQARAVSALTEDIVRHSSLVDGGVCLGGMVFEFADEWWKDGQGSAWVHDTTGFDWGGGPYPDFRYNEEWWGLVDIDRNPRLAFHSYKNIRMPITPLPPQVRIPSNVTVEGRRLLVNGEPVHLKGVNWNPVPRGKVHPQGLDYRGSASRDGDLMRAAGINALRSYECICDPQVLDILWNRSIFVLNTVFASSRDGLGGIEGKVNAVKDHPAVLMWVVGNEWNYNGCYDHLSHDECMAYIREAASIVKQHDNRHPVATIYGRLPKPEVIQQLSVIDIWGVNYYHGLVFHDEELGGSGDLFREWAMLSGLPLFIGEYGADAWDTRRGCEDQEAQAEAVTALTEEIAGHSSLREGVCLGGMVFEFADEWWKDYKGNAWTHDTTGFDWGGGPHPDMRYNEEWWGLVDIDRNPRKAYHAYKNATVPGDSREPVFLPAGSAAVRGRVMGPPPVRRLQTPLLQV